MPPLPKPMPTPASLDDILSAIGDINRWRILVELSKGEPLPVAELSRRIGRPANVLSKHIAQLREAGIVTRGFGNLYRIPADTLDIAARTVDIGPMLLRLDTEAPPA